MLLPGVRKQIGTNHRCVQQLVHHPGALQLATIIPRIVAETFVTIEQIVEAAFLLGAQMYDIEGHAVTRTALNHTL